MRLQMMVKALSLMRVEVSRFGAFICLISGSSKLVRWPFLFSALSSSHGFPDQMELWNIFPEEIVVDPEEKHNCGKVRAGDWLIFEEAEEKMWLSLRGLNELLLRLAWMYMYFQKFWDSKFWRMPLTVKKYCFQYVAVKKLKDVFKNR